MKKDIMRLFVCLLICLVSIPLYAEADWPVYPQKNIKKWKIAYYEGGPFETYNTHLTNQVRSLMELGWIESKPLPKLESSKAIWEFLATQLTSPYIEFVEDGYYSGRWEKALRQKKHQALLKRLNNNEFDMLWAMGTRAGQAFANNEHSIPTMVFAATDAIAAGIVKSADDSGLDHIHARVHPHKFEAPLRLFHEFVQFKKLGLPFLNDEAGRSYAAYDTVLQLSHELGFEVIECYLGNFGSDTSKSDQDAIRCIKTLAPQVDVIYLTEMASLKKRNVHNLVPIFLKYKIPTLSQYDDGIIGKGVLMTVSTDEGEAVGLFSATTMAKIFNGAKPRDLPQVFSPPPRMVINMKTALEIGFEVPSKLLDLSDRIYTKIEP